MTSCASTFILNKKLFKVHAEHHHEFSPNWLKQYLPIPQVTPDSAYLNATGVGAATAKSAYMVTFRDRIKLRTKISAKGNKALRQIPASHNAFQDAPGWTGVGYADVPNSDQLFTTTWCSQGDDTTNASAFNAFHIQETVTGLFNVSY
jgi:hypothetical protein